MVQSRLKLKYGFGVILLTVIFGASLYLFDPVPLQTLRNATFDQFQRLKPRTYRDVQVRIIDIDDESLKFLGQWPWPRSRIAELVTRLQNANPAAIALDIIFAEPDRTSPQSMFKLWHLPPKKTQLLGNLPDPDQILSNAISQGKVATGFALKQEDLNQRAPLSKARFVEIGGSPQPYLTQYTGAITSLPFLESAAQGNGALTFNSDVDGVVRKIPILLGYRNNSQPSLVAEALRIAQGTTNYTTRSAEDGIGLSEILIGKTAIPTTPKGEIWINYTQSVPDRYISAWKILADKVEPTRLKNHILLIGTSAQGLMDLRFSPMGGVIPGIEIHAQALEQMLSGDWLNRPNWSNALEMLIITAGGILIGLLTLSNGALLSSLIFMLVVTVLWASAWHAYSAYALLIDPLCPSVLLVMTFILSSIIRHLDTEQRQRWVKQAFSRYISPNLVEHLINHPDELELGGRRQVCSFVFTDLAGFTGLMEKIDAAEAVTMLNAYLDKMIAIAFSYQGTLDRIVGDAVAIMFSAPIPQSDHQRRAIDCALAMQRFASQYKSELVAKGINFGSTRIGIHTGEVIVGNFGGNTIFDYRALGDTVNTASRLEGANKYLGTLVCISEATLSGCPDIKTRPIGRLLVQGKTIPLTVNEPLDSFYSTEAEVKEYLNAYELMKTKHPEALAAFTILTQKRPDDHLAALHLNRLISGNSGDLIELNVK
jgi:adenylate cyclase